MRDDDDDDVFETYEEDDVTDDEDEWAARAAARSITGGSHSHSFCRRARSTSFASSSLA